MASLSGAGWCTTRPRVFATCSRETAVTRVCGFDPTAASLHVGHMLPILALARFQRFGHSPIAVVGGGTGLIGDPSFKAAERALLTVDQVEANVAGIRQQLARFLDFDSAATRPASSTTPSG